MLELRPNCENCGKDLPNDSNEAMICTFECTFCEECVKSVLQNVCPNCGGGLEKRPTRPTDGFTPASLQNYPASKTRKVKPVNKEIFKALQQHYLNIDPRKR